MQLFHCVLLGFLVVEFTSALKCHYWLDLFGVGYEYTVCDMNYCTLRHLTTPEKTSCTVGCLKESTHNLPFYGDMYDLGGNLIELQCKSGDFCVEDSQLLNANVVTIGEDNMKKLRYCAALLAHRMNMSGPGIRLITTTSTTTTTTATTTTLPSSTTTETEKKKENTESEDESSAFKNGFFFVVLVVFKMYANYVI